MKALFIYFIALENMGEFYEEPSVHPYCDFTKYVQYAETEIRAIPLCSFALFSCRAAVFAGHSSCYYGVVIVTKSYVCSQYLGTKSLLLLCQSMVKHG